MTNNKIMISVLIVLMSIFISGCVEPQSNIRTASLIKKDLSTAVLTINDMDPGWFSGGSSKNDTLYSSSFAKKDALGTYYISGEIVEYRSLDEAVHNLNKSRDDNKEYRLVSLNIGDESFGYEAGPLSEVIFRKANVIAHVTYAITGGYINPKIDDAKNFAMIIDNRINNIISDPNIPDISITESPIVTESVNETYIETPTGMPTEARIIATIRK